MIQGVNNSLPTDQQKNTAIFICQLLSNLYQPINLFRRGLTLLNLVKFRLNGGFSQ
ncbi:DUF6888 family protein [Crocosphaera sp. XPORK-15E]|uniref:DUF6888 family protein n=1 Tax=Crocosphaera sp. XPORK-15E TaxID=3110247 RepID=UPI003A4DECAC